MCVGGGKINIINNSGNKTRFLTFQAKINSNSFIEFIVGFWKWFTSSVSEKERVEPTDTCVFSRIIDILKVVTVKKKKVICSH